MKQNLSNQKTDAGCGVQGTKPSVRQKRVENKKKIIG